MSKSPAQKAVPAAKVADEKATAPATPETPMPAAPAAPVAPAADDVLAAATDADAAKDRTMQDITITGPQSFTVIGTMHAVADILGQVRYHGGTLDVDGHVIAGPITAESVVELDDDMVETRVTVSFPITTA